MESVPQPLSAQNKNSFAYKTIKERLPVILAKVADSVFRAKTVIKEQHGEQGQEDLKSIAGCVSKMRNELVTSKPLIPIEDNRSDTKVWNDYLEEVTGREKETPSWFTSTWLYIETYMYRRIQEAVEKSVVLKQYDVFSEQKEKALADSHEAVMILVKYLWTLVQDIEDSKEIDTQLLFKEFMQVCLWGNKCDLSISAGMENSQKSCPLDQVNTLRPYMLVDDLDKVWNKIVSSGPGRVDIILDNAGFEVVTDLCLAEFLVTSGLATSVHFHAKAFSWFVSDVTPLDFEHTLQHFMMCNSMATDFFVKRWKKRLDDGSWKLQVHDFWTTPFPYSEMKLRSPDLYEELSKSKLLIFKGDLNYRKLLSDLDWPTTTPFRTSLQGFGPSPLVSLRALKADLVTGLGEGQAEKIAAQDPNWMFDGSWAVISFADNQ